MTTSAPDVAASNVNNQDGRPSTWGDIATKFAWQIAQEGFSRGDLAELRRMNSGFAPTRRYSWGYWRRRICSVHST